MVKVSAERLADSQVLLNIEAEPEELERSMELACRRLANRANIPGFRRGKAPRIVVERYLGRGAILQDALDRLVPELYARAISEQSVEAIAQPQIEVTQLEPVVFKATVPVRPTVELGAYTEVRLSLEPVEVTEEQVNAVLERLRQRVAPWVPVERPVEYHDQITMNVEGTFDGQPFLNRQDEDFYVPPDWPLPLPGFGDKLVGLEKGKETEFTLAYPADHQRKELAGKEGSFKVLVKEIKAKQLPELNDDFAKSLGEGYETLVALKEAISLQLLEQAETDAKRRLADGAVEEVLAGSRLEFPTILVDAEVERMLQARSERLAQSGIPWERYLQEVKRSEEELRAELRPEATEQVERWLVLNRLAEVERIEVLPEEIDAEVSAILARAQPNAQSLEQAFTNESSRETLRRVILTRKTLARLVNIVTEGAVEYPVIQPLLPDVTTSLEPVSSSEPDAQEPVAEAGTASDVSEEK